MSIPVIFSQVTPNIPVTTAVHLASTAGSIITILDIALVNGSNQVNVVSINRVGNILTVVTDTPHNLSIGETAHLENTGVPEFNGKFKPYQILSSTSYSIRVNNSGPTTSGAVGTSKFAAAGWVKFASGTNWACYESAPYPDGLPRYFQVEDNSPYANTFDFRVRVAKEWTALNTAGKICTARKFTKTSSNLRWAVVADNKTIQMFFAGTTNYYIGEAIAIEDVDTSSCLMSVGTDGGTYGAQFGAQSFSSASQAIAAVSCIVLESPFSVNYDTFCSASMGGVPTVAGTALSSLQNYMRFASPISGKYAVSPIDIWEKIADIGQTHYPRCRAKGITQPLGRIPLNIPTETLGYFFPMRETLPSGDVIDTYIFNTTSVTQTSCAHLAINLTMW